PGSVDRESANSSDGACLRQLGLAALLWSWPGRHTAGLRHPGRKARASGPAGLAGHGACASGLEYQGAASFDRHIVRLSAIVGGAAGALATRSAQYPVGPAIASAA